MKTKYVIIAIAILLIITFFLGRSCNESDRKLNELKGLYEAHKEAAKEEKEKIDALVREKEAENRKILERNKKLERESEVSAEKIEKSEGELATLKKERLELKDKDEIILNQDKQINSLEFTLTLERKDKADVKTWGLNWKKAYENEQEIRIKEQQKFNDEVNLRELAEKNLSLCTKKLNRTKTSSTLKTVLIGALAGYVVYKTLK